MRFEFLVRVERRKLFGNWTFFRRNEKKRGEECVAKHAHISEQ